MDFDIIVVVVIITVESICSRTVYNVELEASIDKDSALLGRTVKLGGVIHQV